MPSMIGRTGKTQRAQARAIGSPHGARANSVPRTTVAARAARSAGSATTIRSTGTAVGSRASRATRHPAPRWRRRKEQRPAEILAAALDQFIEHGYAASKLEDVARRAGITKGAMYRYFDSKEALFKAVVRQSVLPQIEAFERIASQSGTSARELLAEFAHGWVERIYRTPIAGLAKLVTAESANFPELARFYKGEVIDRTARALQSVIKRGIERGEFRPLDVESAARVLRAPLVMMSILRRSGVLCGLDAADEERYFETYLDLMLNGLLARPEPGHGAEPRRREPEGVKP